MGQLTVMKSEKQIYVDGIAVDNCDMTGIPEGLHVLQWDGSNGHIEYTDVIKPNLTVSSESEIETALGVSVTELIARRNAQMND